MSDYSLTTKDYKATLILNIDRKKIDEKMGPVLKNLSNQISVPGFRKGKVPAQVIKSRIGIDTVVEECVEEIVPELVEKAIESEDLEVVSKPRLSKIDNHKGDIVTATVMFDLYPYIQTGDIDSIELQIDSPLVSDDEIQREIKKQLKVDAELVDSQEDKKVGESDVVTVDLNIFNQLSEDPKPLVERNDMIIDIDENIEYADIISSITGYKAGDEIKGEMNLNGLNVGFTAVIKKIRSLKFPDMTDEWVKSNSEYENKDEFVESIKNKLEETKIQKAQSSFTAALFNHYKDELVNGVHASMVLDLANMEYSKLIDRLKASNLTLEKYLKMFGMSDSDLQDSLTNSAFETSALSVMLRSVANSLNIAPSNEEVEKFIYKSESHSFDHNYDNFKKHMEELRETSQKNFEIIMNRARNLLKTQLAFDYLKENVKLVDADGNTIDNKLLTDFDSDEEIESGIGKSDSIDENEDSNIDSDQSSDDSNRSSESASDDLELIQTDKGENIE